MSNVHINLTVINLHILRIRRNTVLQKIDILGESHTSLSSQLTTYKTSFCGG